MKKNYTNIILFELLGFIITAIIAYLVIYPFLLNNIEFPLLKINFLIVFISLNYIRWQFLIKYSFFNESYVLHAILFVICIFSVVTFYGLYGEFKFFYEEANLSSLLGHLSFDEAVTIRSYMKKEFTFSSVLVIISSFMFGVRLVRSVWRMKNKTNKSVDVEQI